MVKTYCLPQHLQSVRLSQGDCVRYIGSDLRIQQDYGNQDLRIFAIDALSGIAVCENSAGNCLVGVSHHDLQLV